MMKPLLISFFVISLTFGTLQDRALGSFSAGSALQGPTMPFLKAEAYEFGCQPIAGMVVMFC